MASNVVNNLDNPGVQLRRTMMSFLTLAQSRRTCPQQKNIPQTHDHLAERHYVLCPRCSVREYVLICLYAIAHYPPFLPTVPLTPRTGARSRSAEAGETEAHDRGSQGGSRQKEGGTAGEKTGGKAGGKARAVRRRKNRRKNCQPDWQSGGGKRCIDDFQEAAAPQQE